MFFVSDDVTMPAFSLSNRCFGGWYDDLFLSLMYASYSEISRWLDDIEIFLTRYKWGSITYSYLIVLYVLKRGYNIVFCRCVSHVVMNLFWMARLQFTENTFLSSVGSSLRSYTNFNASVAHVLKPCWSSSTRSQNTFFANLLLSILCSRLR